jgi:hypothetical protein
MSFRLHSRRSVGGHDDRNNSSMSHIPEDTTLDGGLRRSFSSSLRFSRPQGTHRSHPPQLYRKNSNGSANNSNHSNILMSVVDASDDGATEPRGKDKYAQVRSMLAT